MPPKKIMMESASIELSHARSKLLEMALPLVIENNTDASSEEIEMLKSAVEKLTNKEPIPKETLCSLGKFVAFHKSSSLKYDDSEKKEEKKNDTFKRLVLELKLTKIPFFENGKKSSFIASDEKIGVVGLEKVPGIKVAYQNMLVVVQRKVKNERTPLKVHKKDKDDKNERTFWKVKGRFSAEGKMEENVKDCITDAVVIKKLIEEEKERQGSEKTTTPRKRGRTPRVLHPAVIRPRTDPEPETKVDTNEDMAHDDMVHDDMVHDDMVHDDMVHDEMIREGLFPETLNFECVNIGGGFDIFGDRSHDFFYDDPPPPPPYTFGLSVLGDEGLGFRPLKLPRTSFYDDFL